MAWLGNQGGYPSYTWTAPVPFRYNPILGLREIRLLKFRPGGLNPQGTVYCEVEHTSLDHHPDYQALSYSWRAAAESGGYSTNSFITCTNGQRLALSGGVLAAIRKFAIFPFEHSWLWVDSLCINQSDGDEKNHQIQLMRDIYRGARQTIIWLGDARDNNTSIQLAFDWLRLIHENMGHLRERHEFASAINSLAMTRQWDVQLSMGALSSLLSREWFGRLWVLQEAVVSREAVVYCGTSYVYWREFCCALRTLRNSGILYSMFNNFPILAASPQLRTSRVNQFVQLYQQFHEPGFQFSEDHRPPLNRLKSLMHVARWMDCTNPKDKIYGVLGLTNDHFEDLIDYKESMTVEILYRDVATRFLSDRNGFCNCTSPNCPWSQLSVLADISLEQPVQSPSWVPKWTPPQTGASFWYSSITAGYNAAGETRPRVTLLENKNLVCIRGTIWDSILSVSEICPPIDSQNVQVTANAVNPFAPVASLDAQRLGPVHRWVTEASELAQQCPRYGFSRPEAFWRTICGNITCRDVISTQITNPNIPLPDDQLYGMYFASFMQSISTLETMLAQNAPALAINYALAPLSDNFLAYFIAFARGAPTRRFFTTHSGYMGLGPRNTCVGDIVCVLDGGPVPMVLRTADECSPPHTSRGRSFQEDHFLLIGECYAHGLMNGEAVAPQYRSQCRDIILA